MSQAEALIDNPAGARSSGSARLDAAAKAAGAARYAGDVVLEGMAHAAVWRSPLPHALIRGARLEAARAAPGVLGVFRAEDLDAGLFGRRVRDLPVLASGKVRFVGEPVVAVVAERREQAEAAVALVEVDLDERPAVLDARRALGSAEVLVHDAPWRYEGAVVAESDGPNLQSRVRHGREEATQAALAAAEFVVDRMYRTVAGHPGYLEPQACVAQIEEDGTVQLWASDKSPYRVRQQLADTFGVDPRSVVLNPILIGGDFGGKGSPTIVPLCVALARAVGRPVRIALRYSEDLVAASPRHPATMRVRLASDGDGRLVALRLDAVIDGGAYAALKPVPTVGLHGMELVGSSYRIPNLYLDARVAYTNSVPKGHVRAPGSPQVTFAFESALDELAAKVEVDPIEIRRRNLLTTGEANPHGARFVELRGREVLEAALAAFERRSGPPGWRTGWGIGVYDRETAAGKTSIRLRSTPGGGVRAEIPVPETGTGSHTVVREGLARLLGIDRALVEVAQVSTGALPYDVGVGASRVTAGMSTVLERAAQLWSMRQGDEVVAEIDGGGDERVTSFCVQIAQVAVDPESGEVRVLELLSALDCAEVLHPAAHRMQIDGGAVMGFGFACLEDLRIEDGQVWAANLGEFRLASSRDAPPLKTVLVTGSRGLGALDVKSVGELTNVPVAAAIANALAAATGVRLRELPITAERVHGALARRGEP
ncbi:MAG TPA: xanthine dehydrogenase family protein molybdopterin-binding subunit [Acidimicrobiales bacterium]|nr:xanthine dehydrogenase family protein molybdopterin-binding subunit [Acidimicrobiales bacterium]